MKDPYEEIQNAKYTPKKVVVDERTAKLEVSSVFVIIFKALTLICLYFQVIFCLY
jgi:hypothetical protein